MNSGVISELQRNSTNCAKVVEDIVKLEKKIFPKHESLARFFDEELKKKNSGLLFVHLHGELVGYVMYSWPSSLSATIAKLAVKENCRRQGHGEALLKAAIDKCKTRNIQRICLHVDPLRTAAVNLYKKFGFQVDSLIEGYYSADRDAYRMQQKVRMLRACIQSLLKFVNSGNGMVGIAMILYGIWLMRAWQRHSGHFPFENSDDPIPWFMCSSLGLGILLCVITCLGHIAAETANGCCLHMYMGLVFVVLMVQAGLATDVFLNHDWEEDFPEDPSGTFDQFKHFIRLNFKICKWIWISIMSIQGLSLLLAMVLKAIGSHRNYDSEDEYVPERLPLLKNALHSPTTCVIGDPVFASKNDAWNKRTGDK